MAYEKKPVIIDMAKKLMDHIEKNNIKAKLLGGVAVYLTCPSTEYAPLSRDINDIDIVVSNNDVKALKKALDEEGFIADRRFNALHGETRMLFSKNDIDLDVFIGKFIQCHELNLEGDLSKNGYTISLANLLLTKLQIVQINYKDILDILAILIDHPVENKNDCNTINLNSILDIVKNDWGWYTTIFDNLEKTVSMAKDILNQEDITTITEKILLIKTSIEQVPKSLKWKIRAKIGRKLQWYNIPEEKHYE
ncbi:nucleotidyltransferase family protein [Thermoanaerobacterium thermosaccharolyticum]|uniref:Nucleotidyltransferase family protein n=1 Tax=Thermoanaerobacterium thermosaccharolyticum M0795 TaxID=698948 RepID=L0IF32_THETR|nr:nucleotidyltransferase family protein [Thermoanaerobacterium thermosaccharolyticum]AGB18165.1 hypothetical protein Thethe_00456 [Thermoanaerobacterium thermosaccharolyticum M0795]